MREFAQSYYNKLATHFHSIRVTDGQGDILDFFDGIERVCNLIISKKESGHKLMFIGNGASAAMSSHMSTDFWKNGGIKAVAFNDISLLTCIGNDYGYKHIFEKPIDMFANEGDILVAISSSGRSENVIRGTASAKSKGCSIVTLSGFDGENPLSSLGDFNFYVRDRSYGPVEIIHHSICHCILDAIIHNKMRQGNKH